MPPIKLGGSKWRLLGATVVFDGTSVGVEDVVEGSIDGLLGILLLLETIVVGVGVVVLISIGPIK